MTLIKKSWQDLFRRVENKKIKYFILFPVMFSTLVATPAKLETTIDYDNRHTTQLVLDQSVASVVRVKDHASLIVPGESAIQKDDRLKAEALAKAQAEAEAAKKREALAREYRVYNDPTDFDSLYREAGAAFGVDPKVLKAIHMVETGGSGSTNRKSYAGATGPMQFLPSTFRRHAVDGNSDGIKDITNVSDAVYTAAQYLRACGYPDVKKALWGYNPSTSYCKKVLNIANGIAL